MKKSLYALVALVCMSLSSQAAPGDTTWVQANNTQLTYYGNFDTTIAFPSPGTSYRKIYMIFTLGKYMCPGYSYGCGTAGYPPCDTALHQIPWCGDWDYTIQNYLMTPGGDTLELGRLISPYANAGAPRTPYTWTQHYIFDVTDYASKLENSSSMRIFFSGYSGGFTANIKFAFIEGTPDRDVKGIAKLWDGSYSYGSTPNINTHFTAVSAVAPTGTQAADLKFTVTGHGSDASNCCEFAAHNYQVMLNSAPIGSQLVWRDNCGGNELYPQSGTWPLRRANWCPGAMVYSNFYLLPGITVSSSFNIGLQFDAYSGSGAGSYTTFGALIYYGSINKTLDASIDGIIAPTTDENYFRENPISGQPIIHIHNSGSTAINSVSFQYGVVGYPMQTYTWEGTLASLADTDVNLTALATLDSLAGLTPTYNFIAEITSVNGVADNDQTNDTMRSQFMAAPKWPASFRIQMYTSDLNTNTSNTTAETSWDILDMNGNVVKERAHCGLNTLYTDTLELPTGYYQFVITDSVFNDGDYDGDFFGLQSTVWYGATGYVPGYLNVQELNPAHTLLPMHGYNYGSGPGFANDFGQGYSQYFYINNPATAVNNVIASSLAMNVFPNPARNTVTVSLAGTQQVNGKIEIIDELGRTVSTTLCTNATQQVDVTKLLSGVYTIMYIDNTFNNMLQTKLIIAK